MLRDRKMEISESLKVESMGKFNLAEFWIAVSEYLFDEHFAN